MRKFLIGVMLLGLTFAAHAQEDQPQVDLTFSVDAWEESYLQPLRDALPGLIDALEQLQVDWRISVYAFRGDAVTTVQNFTSDRDTALEAFARIGSDQESIIADRDFAPRSDAADINLFITPQPREDLSPGGEQFLCLIVISDASVADAPTQAAETSGCGVFRAAEPSELQVALFQAVETATGIQLPEALPACIEVAQANLRVGDVEGAVTDGAVYCREIARDGEFVINPGAIGSQRVVEQGVLQAYDVFGLFEDGSAAGGFNQRIEVCLQGRGDLLFLPAFASPRPAQMPQTYPSGEYTCTRIGSAGIMVLVGTE